LKNFEKKLKEFPVLKNKENVSSQNRNFKKKKIKRKPFKNISSKITRF